MAPRAAAASTARTAAPAPGAGSGNGGTGGGTGGSTNEDLAAAYLKAFRLQAELFAPALRCDLTGFGSLLLTDKGGNLQFTGNTCPAITTYQSGCPHS